MSAPGVARDSLNSTPELRARRQFQKLVLPCLPEAQVVHPVLPPARKRMSLEVFRQMLNDDELRGKADQLKGRVKDAVGRATGDEQLRDEGAVDEASGKVQEGVGKARRKIGEAIEDIGDSIKR